MSRYRASAGITDDWQHFDFSVTDGVATVTLNRPEKMNPLTFESYADLRDLLAELPHRGDTRVLVIRGEGRGFCGGGDVNEIIGELIQMDAAGLMGFTKMTGDVIRAMRECPIPIIAGIQGIAAGAGSVVAIAADFRICTPQAKFAFLFTKVGLSGGDMGAAYLLPRLVGYGRATELLMLGDTIDAQTADRYGLVTQLTDDLDGACSTLARRLADDLVDVTASAEAPALAADHQHPGVAPVRELGEQVAEVGVRLEGQRVHLLGAIQGHRGDAVGHREVEVLPVLGDPGAGAVPAHSWGVHSIPFMSPRAMIVRCTSEAPS